MKTKNTIILAIATIGIIAVAIIAGIITQQPQTPPPVVEQKKPLPTAEKLASMLINEQFAIDQVIATNYPQIAELYTVNPGKLYDNGLWYGTTLTYKGTDDLSRDTLRVLMQKKNGTWTIRTNPPSIILRAVDYPDAPKSIIQDLNRAVELPGTEESPAIN